MGETLQYGIVGCGGIGASHAEAVEAADGATLRAICDLDETAAAEFADEHGIDEQYTSAAAMIEAGVDAVSICTPSGTHADLTVECAEAGAHVLCEKPLEVRVDRLSWMLDAVERAGVTFGGVYQTRTEPAAQFAKHAVEAGRLGDLLVGDAEVDWFRPQSYYDSAGWRGTRDLDGGVLMNQAPHTIDRLQWLVGDVESVAAHCETLDRDMESEDTAALLLRFENGAVGTIRATTAAPAGHSGTTVDGTDGTLRLAGDSVERYEVADPAGGTKHMHRDTTAPEFDLDDHAFPFGEGHEAVVADFVTAVHEGRDPMVPAEEARKAIDINLAAYRSAETGDEVYLDDLSE
jgi:predicted dehydrogenase